jgi:hypothetical protein
VLLKFGRADRTPRETLQKRLEKTPSNARYFTHVSSLMCMGIAHGAEELGLCFHGLACQTNPCGRHPRVMPRMWPYLDKNQKWSGRQKYSFCEATVVTLSHDEILTTGFLRVGRCRCGSHCHARNVGNARASYRHKPALSIFNNTPLVCIQPYILGIHILEYTVQLITQSVI